MTWVFAAITLGAVFLATFANDIRRAVLSLWVAGLGIGALYLTIGAELLAVVQWVVSTLVAISFVFFSVMFGEYNAADQPNARERIVPVLITGVLGAAFAAVIWIGANEFPELQSILPVEGSDLLSMGKSIANEHLISLEVLALTLFLVLVGGGVVARPEDDERANEEAKAP